MKIPNNVTASAFEVINLNRQIRTLSKLLEEHKEVIRGWAVKVCDGSNTVDGSRELIEIPLYEGSISIVYPRDVPKFVSGVNPDILFLQLIPSIRDMVVKQKVVMASEFVDRWFSIPCPFSDSDVAVIRQAIRFEAATVRIESSK